MSVRLKAIYRDGAFVPIPNGEKLNVSENAEVEITVHDPYVLGRDDRRGLHGRQHHAPLHRRF